MAAFFEKLTEKFSISEIKEFLTTTATAKVIELAAEEILKKIFTENRKDILDKLTKLHERFQESKKDVKEIPGEIGTAHQNSRIFQAEIDISHKFELLLSIMSIDDSWARNTEVERLKAGILDTNTGILSHLTAVHHVLVGDTVTHPGEKGLLEMMSKNLLEKTDGGMTNDECEKHILNFLGKTVILQFKAVILFMVASENFAFCKAQFSLMGKRIQKQIAVVKDCTMPKKLKKLENL